MCSGNKVIDITDRPPNVCQVVTNRDHEKKSIFFFGASSSNVHSFGSYPPKYRPTITKCSVRLFFDGQSVNEHRALCLLGAPEYNERGHVVFEARTWTWLVKSDAASPARTSMYLGQGTRGCCSCDLRLHCWSSRWVNKLKIRQKVKLGTLKKLCRLG